MFASREIRPPTLVGKHKDASELLRNEVFPKMLADHTSFVAKNDPIIVELGNLWIKRSVKNKLRWASYTSQEMRSAARLLECLRRMDSSCETMSDFLTPAKFDMVLRATIEVSGGTEEFCPSFNCFVEVWVRPSGDGAIANDKEMQTDAANFIKLKENKWRYNITSLAHKVINSLE